MRKHKLIYLIGMGLLFALYLIGTDPDSGFIKNLPFGADAVLVAGKLLLASLIILFVETWPDYLTDKETGTTEELTDKAKETSLGSALVVLARAIKILGYVIGTAMIF
jgi:hypothetical protein